jgi:N-acetyl sugar amidotransferase
LCDTTIPSIRFDERGECNFCKSHDALIAFYDKPERKEEYARLITNIKSAGKGRRYDCIVGVSGGTDSIYTLLLAKELGLRPLAVHFDNGWDKDTAVENIKKACTKLGVELYTYVVNWEEFKSLQVAFLKASVPDIEIPTDVAIHGTLYAAAKREEVKYILGGQCFKAEGTVPIDWSFIDGTYIKDVHNKFGARPLKTYPNATVWEIAFDTLVRGIKQVPILNYVEYDKVSARARLERELDWKYYGGHHYENTYSHFAFGYYTTKKFGFDKRKISLSGPVRTGRMPRAEALKELAETPDVSEEIVSYVIKKLGLTKDEFDVILNAPNRSFRDYHTSYDALQRLAPGIKMAAYLGLISPVVYEKFVKS